MNFCNISPLGLYTVFNHWYKPNFVEIMFYLLIISVASISTDTLIKSENSATEKQLVESGCYWDFCEKPIDHSAWNHEIGLTHVPEKNSGS